MIYNHYSDVIEVSIIIISDPFEVHLCFLHFEYLNSFSIYIMNRTTRNGMKHFLGSQHHEMQDQTCAVHCY